MANKEAFQDKLRRLGSLVDELDAIACDGNSVAVRELVQLLMEVHGTAIQRMMEIVFESGAAGEAIIAKAGEDPIVRQLLLLYSLHPDGLQARIVRAIEAAEKRLRKFNSEVELLSIREGDVHVRIRTTGHACGSTAKTVKAIVEECMFDQAPDLTSLAIAGPDDETSSGFVSLESLMRQSLPVGAIT